MKEPTFIQKLIAQSHLPVPKPDDEEMVEGFPMIDEEDREILYHREIHFGRSFEVMIDYYESDGVGAILDLGRIRALAAFEARTGQDIAPLLLSFTDAEKIHQVSEMYETLRDAYESRKQDRITLLADLILAEEEEYEAAIENVVKAGDTIVPDLISLLQSDDFAEAIYPGYGFAPALAARALGKIGNQEALAPLFETLSSEHNDVEEEAIDALCTFGEPAKRFLLQILSAHPITTDTERAAAALSAFPPDEEIAQAAFTLLQDDVVLGKSPLAGYLAISCAGLRDEQNRQTLRALLDRPQLSSQTRELIEETLS